MDYHGIREKVGKIKLNFILAPPHKVHASGESASSK